MARYISGQGNIVKAAIFKVLDGVISEQYNFKYNFSELSHSTVADYNLLSPPGSFLPTAIYKATPGKDITFSILLDHTEGRTATGSIADISFLESLVIPDVALALDSGARWVSPPTLILVVGERSWEVVCTNVSFREVMFNRDLTPTRVMVDISFKTIYIGVEEARRHLIEMRNNYSERVIF